MTTDYQTNQALKNQSIGNLRKYLEDNKAEKDLLVSVDFLEEYILNLECDIEISKTSIITELTHHEEY